MNQIDTCKATWSGGRCDRAPNAAWGLCQGHYAQWRRQTNTGRLDVRAVYKRLLQVHGEGPRTAPVTVHLPQGVALAYKRAAKDAGLGVSELLRPWLESGFLRHQALARSRKALARSRKAPPPV